MTSITPPQDESGMRTEVIQSQTTLNDEDKEELIQKYKYDNNNYSQSKNSIPISTDRQREIMINDNNINPITNANPMTNVNSNANPNANAYTNNNNKPIKQNNQNYSYECNSSASNYENEIGNLRAMVQELQNKNDILSKELTDEQKVTSHKRYINNFQ